MLNDSPALRASEAVLSSTPLAALDPNRPPWPGRAVAIDGRDTYLRHTPGGPGSEPALYVHGLGGSSTNWTDIAALLSPWLDAEAMDLPGFGHSEPAPRGGYTLGALSRRVAKVIERRGEPVHLFGNSLGGAIAVNVAATQPDLVRTLTLISPAMPDLRPRLSTDALLPLMAVPGLSTLAERRLAKLTPRERAQSVIDVCFADPSVVPEHRLDEAAAEVERRRELDWAMDAFVRTLRGLIGYHLAPGPKSLWRTAAGVAAPTLIVWGRQDRLVSVSVAPKLAGIIPGSRLLLLDGIGHTAQLEAPVTVARAVLGLLEDSEKAGPR
ncbi:MAG: alpha/beta fold hydrolase [Mycobacteriales bacterium]